MEPIGIDLGGRESQVCVRTAEGRIVQETRIRTGSLRTYLASRPHSRVVMETCSEAFAVADAARQLGHEVRVVPATLVRTLGVGARGIKTDIRDARVQSEVSCRIELPSVHVASMAARELKSMLNLRDALVSARTQLSNTVRGYLRGRLLKVRCTPETMPQRVRAHLLAESIGLAASVERQLLVLEELNRQIKAADQELSRLVESDGRCRLLMSAPAVGPVTAARFVSTIDDPTRFDKAKAVTSYLGLTPGERSSSDRQHRTGLTQAGPKALRRCLVQVSWHLWRMGAGEPLRQWAAAIAERRGKNVAVCALARQLAGVLWAMWREGRAYQGQQAIAQD